MGTDQRRLALERAMEVKLAGAQLKASIRAGGRRGGAIRAARAVEAGESSLRFFDLLRAVPGVGDERARRMLGRSQISPWARVNDELVTPRRRQALAGELTAHSSGKARRG